MPLLIVLPPATPLVALHQARELLVAQGMGVLGVWALLNLLASGYFVTLFSARQEGFHFHLMNAGWGFVNAVLAAYGIISTHPGLTAGITLAGLLADQLHLENLLLLNAGLDVAYVATGFWLRTRALLPSTEQPARLAGFGRSLWLQGAALLVFDAGFWMVVHHAAAPVFALVERQ